MNPPGKKRYIRDYYCSKVSKARYVYQPVDLLVLSGILYRKFDIKVVDSIVENLSAQNAFKRIDDFSPEAIIFLTGAVSKSEDLEFIGKVKEKRNVLAIASGDFLMENPGEFLKEQNTVDAVLLDFTSDEIVGYINSRQTNHVSAIVDKANSGTVDSYGPKRAVNFVLPVPRHELFLDKRYAYPFVKKYPFASVLTDYGCPFKCPFCVMPNIGYKYRQVDNVLEEVSYLNYLGVHEIYFADQTFGAVKKRALELCRGFARLFPKLGWVCFSRVDVIDKELLSAMKGAGCHTIIFGIETGSRQLLKQLKGIEMEQAKETVNLCRKYKIRVVATFMIGLPGETNEDIKETIKLAKGLDLDYMSINIAIPRANTRLRQEAIEKKLWLSDSEEMDQSGTYSVMGTGHLSKEEVVIWHKRAVRNFYLRPQYLLKRLRGLRSWREAKMNVLEGLSLIKGVLKP